MMRLCSRCLLPLIIAGLLSGSLLMQLPHTLTVYAAPAAPAVFGALAGRVTDVQGNPLAGIRVELYRRYEFGSYTTTVYNTTTDATGHYRLGLIITGIYVVRFRDPVGLYTTQYYPAAYEERQAIDLSVSGAEITGIDDTLQSAGQISGIITTTNELTLGPVEVTLYRLTPAPQYADMQTLAAGEQQFSFGGLRSGRYAICASGKTTDPYQYIFQECYDDYLADPLSFQADPITVTAGMTINHIDFSFGDGTNLVTINGVTLTTDDRRLAGINLVAWRWWQDGWNREREGQSRADGSFQLVHLRPGRYALGFDDPTRTYVFEQQSIGLQLQNVITVDLPLGGDQQVVTATLIPGAQITGVVTLQGEAFPSYSNVILYARGDAVGLNEVARAPIDPLTGRYHLRGLTAGTYQLYAEDYHNSGYFAGYYGADQTNAAADIGLARSEIKGNMNFTLYPDADLYQGLITGTVTANQRPLAGIKVQLFHHVFDGRIPFAFTFTDVNGNYRIGGLPRGGYFMGFSDPQQIYASIYYPNQRFVLNDDEFLIDGATIYTNVNAELVVGGIIEGHVYKSTGEPLADATVIPYWYEGGIWRNSTGSFTNEAGYYQLPALVPDTYRLGFSAWVGHSTGEFYDNEGSIETATDLIVRAGTVLQADVVIGPRQVISTAYLPLLQR